MLIYCKRFVQSARPGPEKACLLELFFTILGVCGISLGSIFVHWKHFGSVGAHFLVKVDWAPKAVPRGATPGSGVTLKFF